MRRVGVVILAAATLWLGVGCAQQKNAVPAASNSNMEQLLVAWEAEEDLASRVDAFVSLARSAQSDTQLRAFDLSEKQYRSLDEDGRTEKLEFYISIQGTLRRVVRAAIERAKAQAAAGDMRSALQTLDAVDRIAQANAGDDVVLIGQLVAQAIQTSVSRARSTLSMPSNSSG